MTATCIGPGHDGQPCGRPVMFQRLQLCHGHRNQHYRNGGVLKPVGKPRGASTPEAKALRAKGRPTACTGPADDGTCGRPIKALEWCAGHHKQHLLGKELTPIGSTSPKHQPCTGPQCDRLARAKGLCGAHSQQQRSGKELTPIGSTVRRARQPRPKATKRPTMPEGWYRKTLKKPVPPTRYELDGDAVQIDFIVPVLPDELADRARRNLLARGADDLLDMLGLAS